MTTALRLNDENLDAQEEAQFVKVYLGNQAFGIPVLQVHDILKIDHQNRVPLAPTEVSGVINLRGRVVTSLSMRRCLKLPPAEQNHKIMSVVIDYKDELYSLEVDRVSEVQSVPVKGIESVPSTLDAKWQAIAGGVYRLDKELLVVLNIDQLFASMDPKSAVLLGDQ